MFLENTLYVRPNTNMSKARAAISVKDITDEPFKVMDIWYTDDQVSYGVVNKNNQMTYLPFNCWIILDSKTKKPYHQPTTKEVTNVEPSN